MGRRRTYMTAEQTPMLHPDVERILNRTVRDLHELRGETLDHVAWELRKSLVRILNRAADHADGIREAQTLRGAAMLFSGKSLYDKPSKAARKAELSSMRGTFDELARYVGLDLEIRDGAVEAFDAIEQAIKSAK